MPFGCAASSSSRPAQLQKFLDLGHAPWHGLNALLLVIAEKFELAAAQLQPCDTRVETLATVSIRSRLAVTCKTGISILGANVILSGEPVFETRPINAIRSVLPTPSETNLFLLTEKPLPCAKSTSARRFIAKTDNFALKVKAAALSESKTISVIRTELLLSVAVTCQNTSERKQPEHDKKTIKNA
jgi:hypothetical protein